MAVVWCRKYLRRMNVLKLSKGTTYQCLSSASASMDEYFPERSVKVTKEKSRVLEALASTVRPTGNASLHGFFEDPFLMPRASNRKNEFIKAREEGRKAAEYIIKSYGHLFPLRKPEPAWPLDMSDVEGSDEKALLDWISLKHTGEAINLYEKLISEGVPVSLETENKLLELTGYFGTIKDSALNEQFSEVKSKNKWSSKNFAHHLFFNRMSKKNAKTYEAMILSLLKFGKHTLLLEVLDVMKRNDMKGTVFLYNELIQHAEQLCPTDPWSYAEDVVKLHMNTNPIVQPNVGTFRSLLKVRAKHSSSPFEDVMRIIREMVNLGMEPSFGCYTQVLMAAERERKGLVAVHVVVNRLLSVKKSLSPEDSTDYDFFAMAMTSARHFRDGAIAGELFRLSERSNFRQFLAEKSSFSFYGNLLCALALSQPANEVMDVYKQLVPAYFIPREWIYVELLRCLEKSKQPRVAIDLYNDMKQHRVSMTFNTCRSFMSCFSVKLGKELPEYVRIMEEIIQWAAFFDIETDDFMKSQMIRIYCLNGQYERAWECMEKFSQNKFEPSFVALSSLLHGTIVRNNKADAMKILKMIAEKGFVLNVKSRNTYYRHLEFTANESYEIDQLFVHRPNRVSSQRK